jgi:hypothetical protein
VSEVVRDSAVGLVKSLQSDGSKEEVCSKVVGGFGGHDCVLLSAAALCMFGYAELRPAYIQGLWLFAMFFSLLNLYYVSLSDLEMQWSTTLLAYYFCLFCLGGCGL